MQTFTADHIVQVPKAFWGLKVAQTVLTVLVLAASCFLVAVFPYGTFGYGIFVGLYSLVALIYYFVSIHSKPGLYNWIALLVLECFNVIWWLSIWASLATAIAIVALAYNYDDTYYTARLLKRQSYAGISSAASAIFYIMFALSLVNWVLYIVTLGFFSVGIHRHRKAGKPITANGHSKTSAWGMANNTEKNEMNPIQNQSSYPNNNNYASNGPTQMPSGPYEQSPYQSNGYHPPTSGATEMNGGARY